MAQKLAAVPLPADLTGKRVLDLGCDMGAWCFEAAARGAAHVIGIDRNRPVRGQQADLIALCRTEANRRALEHVGFHRQEMGLDWRSRGPADLVLMLSVYHHVYAQAGAHEPVWFWLRRQVADDGVLLWEGPLGEDDPVVRANVPAHLQPGYARDCILLAAGRYFSGEYVGPARHSPTREVLRFLPHRPHGDTWRALPIAGAGGATRAFEYAAGRRVDEIEAALGYRPFPGSLNLRLDRAFDWHRGYYTARILDVADRARGLDQEWLPRRARLYPVRLDGIAAHAFRFEAETYPPDFVELIAPERLRDRIGAGLLTLETAC